MAITLQRQKSNRASILLVFYLAILIMTDFAFMQNPLTYIILLVLLTKISFFILNGKSSGIKIDKGKIMFNHSILLSNIEIPLSAITKVDTEKKCLFVDNLKEYFRNPLFYRLNYRLNKDRVVLENIAEHDLLLIEQEIAKIERR